MQYGRTVLGNPVGFDIDVSADGSPLLQQGVTVDWSLVAAVSGADVTLNNGQVIPIGEKYLRYGQVLCKVTQAEIGTVDLSGDDDPTGGTWTLTIAGDPPGSDAFEETLEDIAWNVSAATLQAAIRALPFEGAELVTVGKSSFVYTITFPPESGNITLSSNNGEDLTGGGGDTFAITVGTSTGGLAYGGKYGPYDPSATDGRQTLTQGDICIVRQTVLKDGVVPGVSMVASDYPPVLVGGRVFKARVLANNAAASLAAGPLWSALIAAMPNLRPVIQ